MKKFNKIKAGKILIIVFLLFSAVITNGTNYYVKDEAHGGNDASDGLTPYTAWKTIGKVNAEMINNKFNPGDAILFERGSWFYGTFEIRCSGTAVNPIVFGAYGTGNKPVFIYAKQENLLSDWSLVAGHTNIWENRDLTFYVDVANLIFNGGAYFGTKKMSSDLNLLQEPRDFLYDYVNNRILIYSTVNPASVYSNIQCVLSHNAIMFPDNDQYIRFENLDFRYFGKCVVAEGGNYCTYKDLDISYIGGADLGGESNPYSKRFGHGLQMWNGVHDVNITGCTFDNIYEAGVAIAGENHSKIYIENNVITNCEYSLEFWDTNTSSSSNDIKIMHNTCVNAGFGWSHNQRGPDLTNEGTHFIFGEMKGTYSNISVQSNIFCGSKDRLFWILYPEEVRGKPGFTLDNNCFFKNGIIPIGTLGNEDKESLTLWQTETGFETNSIEADPMFVSSTDFHLQNESPCIGRGIDGYMGAFCPCYVGNKDLTSQTEVNEFHFPCITGRLTIRGALTTNLESLTSLVYVGGVLRIEHSSLTKLSGLQNLMFAGGVDINSNYLLENLDGLEKLSSVGVFEWYWGEDEFGHPLSVEPSIFIVINPALTRFCGLYPLLSGGELPGEYIVELNACNPTELQIKDRGPCDAAQAKIGNTEVFSLVNASYWRRALPVTFCEKVGDIQSISIYHNGGTGNMLLGVYADNSGLPGSLLGVTASTPVSLAEGWQTVSLSSPVAVNSGQTVWLAWVFQKSVGVRYIEGIPSRAQSGETWSKGMPASFGASTIGATKFSIYCTYSTIVTPTLDVSPTTVLLAHNSGANGTFNITSNTNWTITDDADWLDVLPTSGSNNAIVTVTANSVNTGPSMRTAIVSIAATGGLNKTVTVTQEPEPIVEKTLGNTDVYSLSNAVAYRRAIPVTFSEDGDIQSITIYHNGGSGNMLLGVYADNSGSPGSLIGVTPLTTVNGAEDWQKVSLSSPVSVTSGQKVWLAWVFQNSVGVRYMAGTPGRAQSLGTWSSGMPATFGTSAIGTTKFSIYCTYTTIVTPTLDVSPTTVSLAYNSGANGTFNITSNTNWTITDDAAWLDVLPTSGANNAIVTVTANSANTGSSMRTAIVSIAASGGLNKTVTVTQDPEPVVEKTLGNTDVYTLVNAVAYRRAIPVTFSENGDIQSISIYHNGGSGNMLLGVYTDNSGSPGSLLGVTPSTPVNGAEGWQKVSLSSVVSVNSGQKVWLSWVFQNSVGVRYIAGTPGRAQSLGTWSSGMPASFGTSTIGTTKFSIYCTYTTSTKSAEIATAVIPEIELADLKVYPNPFSDRLRFEFVSPESVNARIDLYDMTGRLVKNIFEQPIVGGVNYEAEFKPDSEINGMYFYRVIVGNNITNGKVVYSKE